MSDPRKLGAAAMDGLPPPDRLKKRAPSEDVDEDEGMGGGESAMADFLSASQEGDAAGMLAALKTAVEYCRD